MIGISRLDLDSALRAKVDDLVKEGWKLSQDAGKGLSKEAIEGYQKRCDGACERARQRKAAPLEALQNQDLI